MIEINEKNKETIKARYGKEIFDDINYVLTQVAESIENNEIPTIIFESSAHDNLRNIQFSFINKKPYFCHRHSFYEFVYVLDCAIIQHISGHNLLFEKGDGLFFSLSPYHSSKMPADAKCISIKMKKKWFEDLASRLEECDYNNIISRLCRSEIFAVIPTGTNTEFAKKISELTAINRTVYRSTGLYDNCRFENLFTSALITLARENNVLEFSCQDKTSEESCISQQIFTYIINNYNRVSADDVAEHFGFSRVQINRILKKHTGKSFSTIVATERMKQAKILLLNTKMPIQKIALELGFENSDSFSYFFKKHRTISPSQYRKFSSQVGKLRSDIKKS